MLSSSPDTDYTLPPKHPIYQRCMAHTLRHYATDADYFAEAHILIDCYYFVITQTYTL
jgi:hypothetical protein